MLLNNENSRIAFAGIEKYKSMLIFVLLAVLATALFLPVIAGWRGIFHDDQAMEEFSRYYFVAKNFQRGIIPLWDSQSWCGAIPFYARYYADTYYLPQWPFYFLANLKNLDSVYWFLILLPLWLHYILAAAGMFLLTRRLLKCGYLSSGFAAMAYIYSPTFTSAYVWQQVIHVQAWLPWLIIAYVSIVERLRLWKICATGIIMAFILTGATPTLWPFLIFIWAGIIITQMVTFLRDNKKIRSVLRPFLIALLAIIIGVCLSAVYLYSSLDGSKYTQEHIKLTARDILNEPVGSLPPVFLGTLFIPGMFGNITGKNMQQLNPDHDVLFWEANLSGGMFMSLLVFLGIFSAFFRSSGLNLWQARERRYVFLFIILFAFALLCVLGRHIPFYRYAIGLLPGIGQIPRPIRYRFIQCFSAAVLGAAGLEYILSELSLIKKSSLRAAIWSFIIVSFLVVAYSFTYPWDTKEKISYEWSNIIPHSVDGYFSSGQPACMYSPPGVTKKLGAYFNDESSGEIRYCDSLDNGPQEGILAVNYYVSGKGWHEFDVDIPGHKYVWIYQKHGNAGIGYRKLAVPIDSFYYENKWSAYPFSNSIWFYNEQRRYFSPLIIKLKENNLRWQVIFLILYWVSAAFVIIYCTYFLTIRKACYLLFLFAIVELFIIGLFSFYYGNYTFDREFPNHERAKSPIAHPILRRVTQNLFNITKDSTLRIATTQPFHDNFMRFNNNSSLMGYEMHPLDTRFKLAIEKTYNRPFNYSIYYEDILPQPGHTQFLSNFSVGFLMSASPVGFFRGEKVLPFTDESGFSVHINPDALPRVFTINNPVAASEEEQLRQLVSGDLHEAVFVSYPVYKKLQELHVRRNLREFYTFSDLQDKNRIVHLALNNPNYIEVDINVAIPSMLVQTEVWHPGWRAMVDGLSADVYRVNYCQRGIWLDEGWHRVRVKFQSEAWRIGAGISMLTAVLIMVLFTVVCGVRFLKNKVIRHI